MKTFLYKFRNNCLSLNNRINAFDPDIDPRCTFCKILDPETEVRDSFRHFFLSCPVSNMLIENFVRTRTNIAINMYSQEFANFYWYGLLNTDPDGTVYLLILDTLRFCLWKFKKSRKIPTPTLLWNEFFFMFTVICRSMGKYKSKIYANNMVSQLLQARG